MALTKVTNSMILGAITNVMDLGVVADGVTNDATAMQAAVNSGATELLITQPVLINGVFTSPSTVTLNFQWPGKLILGASGNITINGLVVSDYQPIEYGTKTDNVVVNPITFSVPSDFPTIQEAVDAVPTYLWQRITIALADGTYNEDVRVENKQGAGAIIGQPTPDGQRAILTIVGAANTPLDPDVKVRSFFLNNCSGSAFHPTVANMTVFDANPYTDGNGSIEFYGCPTGAVSGVSFDGNGVAKCITSYQSTIAVEGVDFGPGVNENGLVVKHFGEIDCPNDFVLSGAPDITGTVTNGVVQLQNGIVLAANLSKASSTAYDKYDVSGLRTGFMYEALNGALYGPRWFSGFLSSYQTYFSSTSEFETSGSGTATFVASEGIQLSTTSGNFKAIWIRRNRSIATDQLSLIPSSEFIVSLKVNSITGDGEFLIGNKGSAVEDGLNFKITTAGLEGYFQSGTATPVSTGILVDYATLISKNSWVLRCKVERSGNAIFQAIDEDFNAYVGNLAVGTVTGTSTFPINAVVSSASSGTANVYLSEYRCARF